MSNSSDNKSDSGGPAIEPADIQGLKYFRKLRPLLERLHGAGTERDKASNRSLHMVQCCTLILLWLFSPVVDSLRGLQQVSELDKVRRKLGVGRASLGSLSESVTLFDPEPLKQIAEELAHDLPVPGASKFDSIDRSDDYGCRPLGGKHGGECCPADMASEVEGQITVGVSTAYAL